MTPGTRIGPYEILAPLGKGGMGEVWRATDTALGREVAVKSLPDAFSRDPDRVARFEREAKVLASLNHPNIAAIYGLEEHEGSRFLILELVDGETLAERLERGRLSVDESLKLAGQIADALEEAHGKGVVHRDLKPANIKITTGGKVKVLDFGLARAFESGDPVADLSLSPTVSMQATAAGILLGTAAYMSPEVARGEAADRRADVWAFGCVLFEMLTGRQAFVGSSLTDLLASVLKSEPDWSSLPDGLDPRIRLVLEQCLEKDAAGRFRDVADVRVLLGHAAARPLPPVAEPAPRQSTALLVIGAVLLAGLGVLAGALFWGEPPPRDWRQFDFRLPGDAPVLRATAVPFGWSHDGRYLAYTTAARRLFLYDSRQDEARPVVGGEGGHSPFFSPDDAWLGFVVGETLWKVPVTGGDPVPIVQTVEPKGAVWSPDGTIFFAPLDSAIMQVSENGGEAAPVTMLGPGEVSHRWPDLLPGGVLLYTAGGEGGWDDALIVAQDLATGARRTVVNGGTHARYAATGHLVYGRYGALHAVPFDPVDLEPLGQTATLVEGVWESQGGGNLSYAFSDAGNLVYDTGVEAAEVQLVWIDREGAVEPLDLASGPYSSAALSPDGRRIAVWVRAARDQIWIWDVARGTFAPFADSRTNFDPTWRDNDTLRWMMTSEGGQVRLVEASLDSPDDTEVLDGTSPAGGMGSSPDGTLAFVRQSPDTGADIWTVRSGEDAQPLLTSQFNEVAPKYSPDGRWLAYLADPGGIPQLHVVSTTDPSDERQVSREPVGGSAWSPNGRELFFANTVGIRVVDAGDSLDEFGEPRPVFDWEDIGVVPTDRAFGVAADGRFLVGILPAVSPEDAARERTHVSVFLDWFQELQSRARPGR